MECCFFVFNQAEGLVEQDYLESPLPPLFCVRVLVCVSGCCWELVSGIVGEGACVILVCPLLRLGWVGWLLPAGGVSLRLAPVSRQGRLAEDLDCLCGSPVT